MTPPGSKCVRSSPASAAHSFYFWAQFLIREYRRNNLYMLLSLPLPLLAALAGLLLTRLLPGGVIVQGLAYVAVYAVLITLALRAGISDEIGRASCRERV